jgi:HPt (histidine-containing phosphotransfer) domain-containing protein
VPEGAQDGEKARGVLRLLEAGHFKGVADVRLRINFFEQLSAGAAARGALTARSLVSDLIETINGQVDELIGPLADGSEEAVAIEDLRSEFESAVHTHVDGFVSGERVNLDGLAEAIQSSFNALVDELRRTLMTPDGPEAADEPAGDASDADHTLQGQLGNVSGRSPAVVPAQADVAPDDTVVAPQHPAETSDRNTDLEAALASLVSTFDALLSQLLDSVGNAFRMPDPSPPSGEGVAYNRFMDIYNELRGVASEVDDFG